MRPVARHLLQQHLRRHRRAERRPSIAITGRDRRAASARRRTPVGSLLTAMRSLPHDAKRPALPPQVRPRAADAPDGVEDRRPQRGRRPRRSAPDTISGPAAAAAAPNEARARSRSRPRSLADSLSTLVNTICGGHVFRPQPFVQLPLLVLDPAARVDQDHEQRQRAARARVAFDQRLPARGDRPATPSRSRTRAGRSGAARRRARPRRPPPRRTKRSENITRPRVRPGVFDVRARPLRPASRLSSVDLPTFDRPAIAISGAARHGQIAERARFGDEHGFFDVGDAGQARVG